MRIRFGVLFFLILIGSFSALAEVKSFGSPPYSGFLKSSFSKLEASQEHEGLWSYVDKSRDFKPYNKLILAPVMVYNPPYLTGGAVPPSVLYKMRNDMLSTLTDAFASGYEIVQQPGPDVLKVKISVFGVQMVKPGWKLGDNIPIKKGLDLVTGGKVVPVMTAEMEILDAEGHAVAAAIVMRKGEKELFRDDEFAWEDMQPIVSYWAKGLRKGFDQLRGL